MEWHYLAIDGDPDPADAIEALVDFVRREHESAGSPDDFRVYHDASRVDRPIFYFSPEASAGMRDLRCFETTPCPPPPHPEVLSRVV